jgi:hypothetical protein
VRKIIGLAALARSGKDTVASILLTYPHVAAFALADPLKAGCQALFGLTDAETWDDSYKEKPIGLWGKSPRELFQTVGTEWMRHHNPEHWLTRAEREINRPEDRNMLALSPGAVPETEEPFAIAAMLFFDFTADQITNDANLRAIDDTWGLSPREAIDLIKRNTLELFPDFEDRRAQRPAPLLKQMSRVPADAQTVIIKDIRFENEATFLRKHQGQIWHIKRPNTPHVNPHSSEHGITQGFGDVLIKNDGTLKDLENSVRRAWVEADKTPTQTTPSQPNDRKQL